MEKLTIEEENNSFGLTDEIIKDAYDQMWAYENEIDQHNHDLLKSICKTVFIWFKQLMDDSKVTGKIEFVNKPDGEKQRDKYGIFKEVWVRQWTGYECDDYYGFIYARLADDRWLKIPYAC